ncbi:hypothetical protein Belba_3626 [Belliella baltica DSM 15883]|uniref:Uncharacterized protein n=1 Tax=Belliella baltica (strain DSM 15883 / CIP 108006 / LMG 21964 / BA134) TaxID=866536 RepID=I3ZA50_BELBD|nr:hypothetical protein Belba_3626 [Belliella baltica DSM 15883]
MNLIPQLGEFFVTRWDMSPHTNDFLLDFGIE